MKIFLLIFRRIFRRKLSIEERRKLLKALKAKRNKDIIARRGL